MSSIRKFIKRLVLKIQKLFGYNRNKSYAENVYLYDVVERKEYSIDSFKYDDTNSLIIIAAYDTPELFDIAHYYKVDIDYKKKPPELLIPCMSPEWTKWKGNPTFSFGKYCIVIEI